MAAYDRIISTMREGGVVLLDGATGTELERRGAEMDPHSWCGAASKDNASLLSEIHSDYIDAGSRIITANTFASSRLMLEGAGLGDRVDEINTIAVKAALEARDRHPMAPEVVVAGSLSHMSRCPAALTGSIPTPCRARIDSPRPSVNSPECSRPPASR